MRLLDIRYTFGLSSATMTGSTTGLVLVLGSMAHDLGCHALRGDG
ncbi:hypothetical protein ABZ725_51010 [Streptomyces sp. NPDC006872]